MLVLKNEKILHQHQQLTKVNETRKLFLTIIGHDLRNPIGALKDTLSQLKDYPEMFNEEMQAQIIGELREETENIYFLLDNLLSWAKTQQEGIQLNTKSFKINESIDQCIQLHKRLADNKNIVIDTKLSGNYMVSADPNMISLVLRNLLSNAIKFTRQDGHILISTKKTGNEYVEISVKDDGIGIPSEMQKKLFDKHRHLSTYGTNQEKGSGLGLMLCTDFVELNGGKISIKSNENEGSTFNFTLKLWDAAKA